MSVERHVPIFSSVGAPTTVLGWLVPGDTVRADIDHVRWSRVGAVLVLRTFKQHDEEAVERTFSTGDTLPLLGYVSEGRYQVWHDSAMRVVMAFWNDGLSWPPLINPPARLLHYNEPTLWLRVRATDGIGGWIAHSNKLRPLGKPC